jgi:hypothetical protein
MAQKSFCSFLKTNRTVCFLYGATFFLFIGCQSGSSSSLSPAFKHKVLLLSAADDPVWLNYFLASFFKTFNEEKLFEAIPDKNLNDKWLAHSANKDQEVSLEDKILFFAKKMKKSYQTENLEKARHLAFGLMNEAGVLLSLNPGTVSSSYAMLAFWAAIAHIQKPTLAINYGLIYEKYASFRLKDFLESQVHVFIVEKLKTLVTPHLKNQKIILVSNSQNCTLFLNGQELKTSALRVPYKMFNVLFASCINGYFTKTFFAQEVSKIHILPKVPTSFSKLLNVESLPKSDILAQKKDFSAIVLLYWSYSGEYLDCLVVHPQKFYMIKKTRLILSTKKELSEVSRQLSDFLKM